MNSFGLPGMFELLIIGLILLVLFGIPILVVVLAVVLLRGSEKDGHEPSVAERVPEPDESSR